MFVNEVPELCCHECAKAYHVKLADDFYLPISSMVMILCKECGNKRCPKATNHTNDCTGSNEPGQLGSVYGITGNNGDK